MVRQWVQRRLLWKCLVALALVAGTGGFAQAAAGPESLPGQVVGVVGSGSQLSLQLRPADDKPGRTLNRGDVFDDGWVLTDLSPTSATLTRNGQTQTVGLNPRGALAQAAAAGAPTTVEVLLDETQISRVRAAVASGYWDGKPLAGLSQAQTERRVFYDLKLKDALSGRSLTDFQRAMMGQGFTSPQQVMESILGAGGYQDLRQMMSTSSAPLSAAQGQAMVVGRIQTPGGIVEAPITSEEILSIQGAGPAGSFVSGRPAS